MPKGDCGWIPSASFKPAQIALLNSNLGSERLLRQLRRQSPDPYVFSDELPNIHFGMRKKNLRNFYALKYIMVGAKQP
jgi:hypothetical protein